MREAKAALEAGAAGQARAAAEQRERDRQARRGGDDGGTGAGGPTVDEQAVSGVGQRAADAAQPEPKTQRNFTDPQSRIMKNSDGAFIQASNGQAVVDEENQIIIAADVTGCASDCPSFTPMPARPGPTPAPRAPAGTRRRRLLLAGQPRCRCATQGWQGHRDFHGYRAAQAQRPAPTQAPGDASPKTRLPVSGWPASCAPNRPRSLRLPQSHRGTSVRADDHLARCQTAAAARHRRRPRRMAAARRLPQPPQDLRPHPVRGSARSRPPAKDPGRAQLTPGRRPPWSSRR